MAIRYGDRTRVSTPVSGWLNGADGKSWWDTDIDYVSGDMLTYTNVQTNASAHTKGAWTQLIASTASNADVLILSVACAVASTDTAALIDIGIGASGAESVVIPNLAVGGTDGNGFWFIILPIKIPSGSRIAARSQSVRTGGVNIPVRVTLQKSLNYDQAPVALDVIGTSTATSEGTATVTDNTYVELISSTTKIYSSVVVVPSLTSISTGNANPLIDLAVGSSGSEIVINSFRLLVSSSEFCRWLYLPGLPGFANGPFPVGTRFAVRTSLQAPNVDFCLIGIPA